MSGHQPTLPNRGHHFAGSTLRGEHRARQPPNQSPRRPMRRGARMALPAVTTLAPDKDVGRGAARKRGPATRQCCGPPRKACSGLGEVRPEDRGATGGFGDGPGIPLEMRLGEGRRQKPVQRFTAPRHSPKLLEQAVPGPRCHAVRYHREDVARGRGAGCGEVTVPAYWAPTAARRLLPAAAQRRHSCFPVLSREAYSHPPPLHARLHLCPATA